MATVVFITGVNRGIGKGLIEAYLSRPDHIVVGSVRDKTQPSTSELKGLPAASGSKLILVSIESTSLTDPAKAVEEVQAEGVDHFDIVIASAGWSPPIEIADNAQIEDVKKSFDINAVGPLILYQAVKPLLEKSKSPKWVSVSTAAATISALEPFQAWVCAAYGLTKAAQNWFTVAVHAGNKNITAFAIHPGLVQTEMGNVGARSMGLEKAPNTVEESAGKIIDVIDKATRETTSGKFLNVIDGSKIPW